ncbi:MAG: hypothetical protein Q9227_002770 [Pyrenula ochraceoflavens]
MLGWLVAKQVLGWGDGFLNTTLVNGATGKNFGHNGATTVSFVAGGDWANVLAAVNASQQAYQPFVTIQFGHNDQKKAANISIDQYTTNLENLAREARSAGAIPILVTPLSRRNYDTSVSPPKIIENLSNETAHTIIAANNVQANYIDLNRASTDYLNAIGPDAAYTYNLNPTDQTHLNNQGSIVFGGIVANLMLEAIPGLKTDLSVNPALTLAVSNGTYYWPGGEPMSFGGPGTAIDW